MNTLLKSALWPALFLAALEPAGAALVSVAETNGAPDPAALIGVEFGEDVNSFNDRAHQHNGVAFNEATGLLSPAGTLIVGLPSYLVGNEYVLFSNDARNNANYSAVVTADTPSTFYVLIDNRVNGPAAALNSPNSTDPVLGGTLQWVLDGGWQRVNTGISPNGQGDYTGVDESGDGSGPGIAINQFMAVFKAPATATQVTVGNIGLAGNMVSVVAVPTAPPADPIVSFGSQSSLLFPGASTQLTWLISPQATSAVINAGVGNVLPQTDGQGSGSVAVSPSVKTTYTMTVQTPTGNDTRSVTVSVHPLVSFTASHRRINAGEPVVLNWQVRPDAAVSIEGIGDVRDRTDASGAGTLTVQPGATTDYVLTASADGLDETATRGVLIRPAGRSFALIDIGATGGRVEPGSVSGRTVGAAANNVNATDYFTTPQLSDTGTEFTLALEAIDPLGGFVGGLDWRDRGDARDMAFNRLTEDFVKNNLGVIRVTLGQLPAGTYDIVSYHLDPDNSQSGNIRVLVTDADGTARDTGVTGSADWAAAGGIIPGVAGLTTGKLATREAHFQIRADGTNDVILHFDSTLDGADTELPLNGIWLLLPGPAPVDNTWALVDLGGTNGLPEPGAAGNAVVGAGPDPTNATDLEPVDLMSRTNVPFQFALDSMDPFGFPLGGLDWRNRGIAAEVPLARLAQDFVKNNQGMIRARLIGLPAGNWQIQSYHMDPQFSQCSEIHILVTDATRTAEDITITANASFEGHPADTNAPQIGGLWTGLVQSKTATFPVTSNGTDAVMIYFDGSQEFTDPETPLSALRISSLAPPAEVIPVTGVVRTVAAGSAAVAITFTSSPGSTYSVYAAPDPAAWGAPLTPALAATGTSTTFTEGSIPLTTLRRFYQIRKN